MSTEMKTGLVLSGGGAVGAYQAGVVKALAECGSQISMVSGASIGAFNGAIIAASPDLSEAAVRLEALWDHLGNNQWSEVDIQQVINKLNLRPRKCLGWKTPYEVYFKKSLHLV
ncbi:patatin-like phospholipase family protein [Escherichia coli]|uniref:patatin-like phospholipase family protein n=1 Tax=Escherichia coli TaxID=562 RepID=UPI002882F820|nr:patatin-like phospholipase family protein [Escherichia coli]